MFLASVAHLLPSDIQISNRQQQELAMNFGAAYYSAMSGKCWPAPSHIMINLFIRTEDQEIRVRQTDHPVTEEVRSLITARSYELFQEKSPKKNKEKKTRGTRVDSLKLRLVKATDARNWAK